MRHKRTAEIEWPHAGMATCRQVGSVEVMGLHVLKSITCIIILKKTLCPEVFMIKDGLCYFKETLYVKVHPVAGSSVTQAAYLEGCMCFRNRK